MATLSVFCLIVCLSVVFAGITEIDETRYVRAGTDETLSCPINRTVEFALWTYTESYEKYTEDYIYIASKSVPHTSYPRKDRIAVEYDTDNGVYHLTLLKFNDQTDDGMYTCVISMQNDDFFLYFFSVEFADGPSTASITGNVPVFADDSGFLTLICAATANPGVIFQWTNVNNIIGYGNNLTVSPAREDNGQTITCTAMNREYDDILASVSVTLEVHSAPEAQLTVPVAVSEGDRGVEIFCEANGFPDSYNFGEWRHLGPTDYIEIRKLSGAHHGNQSLLTFDKPLMYEDSGIYECIVNNGVLDQTGKLDQSKRKYLQVLGVPIFMDDEDTTYGEIGQNAKIEVLFYSVPEYTDVTWFTLSSSGQHNVADNSFNIEQTIGQRILHTTYYGVDVTVDGYIAALIFKNMTMENTGSYVVVIANEKGLTSHLKKLEISITAIDQTRYVRAGTDETLSCSMSGTVVTAVWLYCEHCDKNIEGSIHVASKSVIATSYPRKDRIAVVYDTENGVYDLTLLNFNGQTDLGKYICHTRMQNNRYLYYYFAVEFAVTHPEEKEQSNLGAAIGGTITVVAVILVCVVVFMFMWKRRRSTKDKSDLEMPNSRINRNILDHNPDEGADK